MGVILIIECDLDREDIWFSVFRHFCPNLVISNLFSFDIDCILLVRISESNEKVFTVRIWTLEVVPLNLNGFIIRRFHNSIWRTNTLNLRSIVVLITVFLTRWNNILPIFPVVRYLHYGFSVKRGRRSFPREFVITLIKGSSLFSKCLVFNWVNESHPKRSTRMRTILKLELIKS